VHAEPREPRRVPGPPTYDPPFRTIDRHFPGPPHLGIPLAHDDIWQAGREWGGYPELEWVFARFMDRILAFGGRGKAYFYEPLTDFDTVRLILRLHSILLERGIQSSPSIVVGFQYFDSAYRTADGRLPMPLAPDPYRGRHYAIGADCENGDQIAFWGWNHQWGDHGRGYLSRDYFEAYVDLVMVRWYALGGPSRAFQRCLDRLDTQRLPKNEHLAHCWPAPNSFQQGTEQINGIPHTVLYWEVTSLQTGCTVDVLEVRDPQQVVGRAHIYHEDDKSSLRELFILPSLRRRGYGSFLEDIAVTRTRDYGHTELELWLHEDDARSRVRATAEHFGESRSYCWRQVSMRRPNVVAIGTKEIQ
jgi:GNAT superfamily N-acetyltransferase